MPWALLLDERTWLVAAIAGLAIFGAVQRLQKEHVQAEYAQYRAEVETEAAKAKVKAALEAARMAQNAQEAMDGLQTRIDRLNRAYDSLRSAKPSSGPVPSLSAAAQSLGTCRGDAGEPDPTPGLLAEVERRVVAILAEGDKELAKYVELYRLEQANAAKTP